jgi:hypothetical protein
MVTREPVKRTDYREHDGDLVDTAERRYADTVSSGKSVPWNEMRRYLKRRLTGAKVARPKARKLSR